MDGIVAIIAGTMLSGVISSILLYILNDKMWSAFKEIEKDLNKLTNKTRGILKFLAFIFTISITIQIAMMLEMNSFEAGLVLGFLQSIKETCFGDNIIEDQIKKRKNDA